MKHEFFLKELGQIEDDGIREFTKYVLDKAPNYFFCYPSSSSGKWHPPHENGPGGLVRHSRGIVYFATILCRAYNVEGKEKDIIISASILHDLIKYDHPEKNRKHTISTHPKITADYVFKLGIQYSTEIEVPVIDKQTVLDICKGIAFHAGRWSEGMTKSFPEDYTRSELIVHISDMCTSGKEVELRFLVPTTTK